MRHFPYFMLLVCGAALAGCGGREEAPEVQPASDSVASPAEQAQAIARDPRMLLFDIQTGLEALHQTGDAYPTTVEFQTDDRWAIYRAALQSAFSTWEYASDGTSYQLTGEAEGRRLAIASP